MVLQEHDNASTADQAAKWEEQRQVSHYAANLAQLEVGLGRHGRQIPSDPSLWVCDETGVKENLWLNLSTGFIGSGRQVCIMPVMLRMYVAAVACMLEAGTRCKSLFQQCMILPLSVPTGAAAGWYRADGHLCGCASKLSLTMGVQNWDGSGGNGAAMRHFEATGQKYPLVVKLGTITANGADVYSYASDESDMVEDPDLVCNPYRPSDPAN